MEKDLSFDEKLELAYNMASTKKKLNVKYAPDDYDADSSGGESDVICAIENDFLELMERAKVKMKHLMMGSDDEDDDDDEDSGEDDYDDDPGSDHPAPTPDDVPPLLGDPLPSPAVPEYIVAPVPPPPAPADPEPPDLVAEDVDEMKAPRELRTDFEAMVAALGPVRWNCSSHQTLPTTHLVCFASQFPPG